MPANDPETEKKWREGLTAVIKELRNTVQTQDVAAIAQRIAEFRREFIGDPTKTLLLKDT
jgi:molecular chaperone GrpE (heat shock protein)